MRHFGVIGESRLIKTPRRLNELEEAVGRLRAVTGDTDSLQVTIDSGQFTVEFSSTQTLESAKQMLAQYVGRTVAVLRVENTAKPLHIRLVRSSGGLREA